MGIGAIIVPRVCGATRTGGDCYSECGVSPFGLPIEHFLRDTPDLVEKEQLGLTANGVKLVPRMQKCPACDGTTKDCIRCNGTGKILVYHIYDIVSKRQYDVADYIEETARFGMSRKIPKNTDFSKITNESMHILLHEHAYIENAYEFYGKNWVEGTKPCVPLPCPKSIDKHWDSIDYKASGISRSDIQVCLGTCWQDVRPGIPVGDSKRLVKRNLPSLSYIAACRPANVTPKYRLAIFAAFPITRLVVVKGPKDAETLEKVKCSGKEGELVDD